MKAWNTLVALILVSLLAACVPAAPAPASEAPAAEAPAAEAEEPAAEAETEGSAASDGPVIKLGYMGPLTGGAAFVGVEQLGFAKVAVELFNERTGLNVQIVEGDDEMNPDVGTIVAERLVADPEVYVVVGPAGSQICASTQPIFEEAGLAHLTPSCTRTDLTDPGTSTFFRPIPTDADQSKTDAAYLVNELGVQSVFLVDDQSSYSVGLDDEMEVELAALGVTEIQRASVSQQETDFSSLVTTILAANPDAVFFPSQFEAQEGTLAAQLREQGYEGIYFLADGGFSYGWVGDVGEAAEGTYVSFFAPDPNYVEEATEYNERYAAQFGDEFGAFGGASALVTYVALDAIERCAENISRECVVEALRNTNLETTPLGIPVSFGENNQIEGGRFFIFQVQDGKFVLVQ